MYYEIYLGSEYSFYPDMNIFYLAEDHSGIVGFLMVYADEADGAEISACVHPARRRQGIFSALFQFACRELERFHYSTILLKTEKAFAGQREFLSHFPDPVDRLQDILLPAVSPVIQNLQNHEAALRRHSLVPAFAGSSAAADQSGHMGTMAVVVIRLRMTENQVKKDQNAIVKINVRRNARIQNRNGNAPSGQPISVFQANPPLMV